MVAVSDDQRSDLPEERQQKPFIDRHFAGLLTGLVSLGAVVVSAIQLQIVTGRENHESDLAEARADREYDMETYKVVIASLSRRDSMEQYAALRLIDLVTDSVLRETLRDALTRSDLGGVADSARQSRDNERRFQQQQRETELVVPTERWRYDVFYCETSGDDARQIADSLAVVLQSRSAEARVRLLPASINVRSGYRVSGFEVRYESNEEERAVETMNTLNAAFAVREGRFRMVQVRSRTPQYLSVFVCPAMPTGLVR